MRILLVTAWFEPDSGAASARFSQLAHHLASRGHQVTVLAPMPHHPQGRIADGYRGAWTKVEMRGQVRVARVWLWASPSPRIRRRLLTQLSFMVGALLRGLSLPRPDLLLIESQPLPTGFAGMLLALWLRVPYVLSVSDLWPDHLLSIGAMRESHTLFRLARRVVNSLYRHARAIVTISPEWTRRIAERIRPTTELHTLYFMVDLQRLRPALCGGDFRRRHRLQDCQIVACIGTFATQYDFDILLQAARRLERRADLVFLLIGDGSQRSILRDTAANVRHISWLTAEDIPSAWTVADISCFALRKHELHQGALPARLFESLASGTPVVAACAGESARIIRESGGGIAVSPGDVSAFTDAIVQLLDNEEMRQRCGHDGRAWAWDNVDVEVQCRRYEQILLRAAGKEEAI
ncbi:MAG: glycosyltransferase family 4 protein [Anaerolineaceae bacterium]|nr:glycosyltransferase family 4 protein [Anaerolineaceae bacterium]